MWLKVLFCFLPTAGVFVLSEMGLAAGLSNKSSHLWRNRLSQFCEDNMLATWDVIAVRSVRLWRNLRAHVYVCVHCLWILLVSFRGQSGSALM